jgi:hypothetical protein
MPGMQCDGRDSSLKGGGSEATMYSIQMLMYGRASAACPASLVGDFTNLHHPDWDVYGCMADAPEDDLLSLSASLRPQLYTPKGELLSD